MIIAVSGSVGAGKTTISKRLAGILKAEYIDINALIKEKKLYGRYTKKFDTYEVDVKKLNMFLIKIIKKCKKSLILDSHLSHYLSRKYVDYCIICKCDIKVLKKRLEGRGYTKFKIRENLNSEIFDVCLVEAAENKHRIIVVDTTNNNVNNSVNKILRKIKIVHNVVR